MELKEQLDENKDVIKQSILDINDLFDEIKESANDENKKQKKRCKQSVTNNASFTSVYHTSINNSDYIEQKKEEKYPGFDYTTMYEKGQTIYYVKVNNLVGEKEILTLRLRSIYKKMLIGCTDKAFAQCIGPDTADMIFLSYHEALQRFKDIKVTSIYKSNENIEVLKDED